MLRGITVQDVGVTFDNYVVTCIQEQRHALDIEYMENLCYRECANAQVFIILIK